MLAFIVTWYMTRASSWCFNEGPCYVNCIDDVRNETQSGQWTTKDLNSVVNEVSSKFSIDSSSLANYFKIIRFTNNAKRAFTTFGFEGTSYESRKIYLGTTHIKITRSNGIYTISGQYVSSTGTAAIHYTHLPYYCPYNQYTPGPFDSQKINMYYEQMERCINDII